MKLLVHIVPIELLFRSLKEAIEGYHLKRKKSSQRCFLSLVYFVKLKNDAALAVDTILVGRRKLMTVIAQPDDSAVKACYFYQSHFQFFSKASENGKAVTDCNRIDK